VSSIAYSSPSIVIDAGRYPDGRRVLYDDYREAYFWLRQVGGWVGGWVGGYLPGVTGASCGCHAMPCLEGVPTPPVSRTCQGLIV
jgi:hypothetical protein